MQGKLAYKGRTSFRWAPNGIPGVATRLATLFSEGVVKGRLDLTRKGTIAVGSDADLVLWDPKRKGLGDAVRAEN